MVVIWPTQTEAHHQALHRPLLPRYCCAFQDWRRLLLLLSITTGRNGCNLVLQQYHERQLNNGTMTYWYTVLVHTPVLQLPILLTLDGPLYPNRMMMQRIDKPTIRNDLLVINQTAVVRTGTTIEGEIDPMTRAPHPTRTKEEELNEEHGAIVHGVYVDHWIAPPVVVRYSSNTVGPNGKPGATWESGPRVLLRRTSTVRKKRNGSGSNVRNVSAGTIGTTETAVVHGTSVMKNAILLPPPIIILPAPLATTTLPVIVPLRLCAIHVLLVTIIPPGLLHVRIVIGMSIGRRPVLIGTTAIPTRTRIGIGLTTVLVSIIMHPMMILTTTPTTNVTTVANGVPRALLPPRGNRKRRFKLLKPKPKLKRDRKMTRTRTELDRSYPRAMMANRSILVRTGAHFEPGKEVPWLLS